MSVDKFMHHFKMPKSEINKLKAKYRETKNDFDKKSLEVAQSLKEFEKESNELFDYFTEMTGKKVNREAMITHISHWLHEGFEISDMKAYLSNEIKGEYYRNHPEMFTIANCFAISDEKRLQIIWDKLAHFESLRNSLDKAQQLKAVIIPCRWSMFEKEWKKSHLISSDQTHCQMCIEESFGLEFMFSPYEAYEYWKDKNEGNALMAETFKRCGDENLLQYAMRTKEERDRIYGTYGLDAKTQTAWLTALHLVP